VNPAELTGRARSHLIELPEFDRSLHMHAAAAFRSLHRAARAAGFDPYPWSSFRDFDRQLSIWNGKFSGARAVQDPTGRALDVAALAAPERVAAILYWSALPGASRHHWGTDVDLVDRGALRDGYTVRLTPDEFQADGPFAAMHAWLAANAARYGFFRPFRGIRSGVQSEPWHYSFAPVAEPARRLLTPALLREVLMAAPLLGKEEVLEHLERLHARYVATIDWP
jgi:LAS superfamily LD-carboxypeptidase LdcB